MNKKKKQGKTQVTFEETSALWLENAKVRIKESTYANYEYLLKKHIIPYFKDLNMRKLTAAQVNSFILYELTEGRLKRREGVSKKYMKDMMSIVKSVVYFCEETYGIPAKIGNMRILRADKPKAKTLSKQEKQRLTEELKKDTTPEKVGIMLGLYTGLRIGEVCGLKWEDFNESRATITVNRTVQRISDNNGGTRFISGSPKTQSSCREIPLPDFVAKLLLKMKQSPQKPIVSHTDRFIEPSRLRKTFKAILRQCGVAERRFHDLRHTFASDCVRLKFDTKTLSEILGHASVSITLDRYVHSDFELKRGLMQRIEA